MYGFEMQLRMMRRRVLGNGLVILMILVTTVFLLLYPKLIHRAQARAMQVGDGIEINGWLYVPYGSADSIIVIEPELKKALADSGLLGSYRVTGEVPFEPLELVVERFGQGNTPEERRQYILDRMDYMPMNIDTNPEGLSKVCALNDLLGDPDLAALEGGIRWLEGFDAQVLHTDLPVCIYPEDGGVELGEQVEVILRRPFENRAGDIARKVVSFQVVGLVDNGGPDTLCAYCPADTMEKLLTEQSGFDFTYDSFTFTLADHRQLQALKELLRAQELDVKSNLRAAVDDRMYEKAMAPLQKNIELLQSLQYVFYVLVVLLGFFLCFLLYRRRKPEYAVMRLLGEPAGQVVLKSLLEQMILCVAGIGLGAGLLLLLKAGEIQGSVCLSVGLGYCLGAAVAVGLTVRVDVMRVLRDQE